jgi:hypothetical protein
MAIVDLYHQRKEALARSGESDVYTYDELPAALRTQLCQIFRDAIGPYSDYEFTNNNEAWQVLRDVLIREFGVDQLASGNFEDEITSHIRNSDDIDRVLSAIELCCRLIHRSIGQEHNMSSNGARQRPEDALKEINYRFRKAGVGYQFEAPQIVRVDSNLLHETVVKPALRLLSDKRFAGAEEEFRQAHIHYREGNAKDAITWASKAFESTMKAACDIKGWTYPAGARASDLLKVLRANRLWPDYLDGSFDQLIATLTSGLPEVRNKTGAHGQGSAPTQIPPYVASYCLHLAAAKILLIVEAAIT